MEKEGSALLLTDRVAGLGIGTSNASGLSDLACLAMLRFA